MSSIRAHSRRIRLLTGAATVLLFGAGGTAIGVGVWGNPPPPQPPSATATPTSTLEAASTPPPTPQPAVSVGPILARSEPIHLTIPAIGVDTMLIQLGVNPDGTVQVPPLERHSPAGWYQGSPTPGELGPSVILGHVDTAFGRSVFYSLGALHPGDTVSVSRADGTVAVFTVDRLAQYPKADFPQFAVYGNTDNAQLRLITCGGVFNHATGHFVDNVVVFASLTSSHPA